MSVPTDASAAVASPCTGVCRLNPAQVCEGCGRSIAEIAEWGQAPPARQRQITLTARNRLAALHDPVSGMFR